MFQGKGASATAVQGILKKKKKLKMFFRKSGTKESRPACRQDQSNIEKTFSLRSWDCEFSCCKKGGSAETGKRGGQVWSFEHVIHHRLEEGGEEGGKKDDQSETTT